VTFFGAGVILDVVGFDVALKGNQSPDTLMAMRVLFAVVPAASSILALLLMAYYPLNDRRMTEIRTELEARRSKVV